MPTLTFSTFLTVPFLALIAVPLVLTAYITICFSILALFIRLSVIYVEFCYAIITNYFVIPTSTNLSLLTFAASEPTSPVVATRRRSSDNSAASATLAKSANTRQSRSHLPTAGTITTTTPTANNTSRPRPSLRRYNSSNSADGHQAYSYSLTSSRGEPVHRRRRTNSNSTINAALSTSAPILSLISGDEGRDFEGLGGWRSLAPPSLQGTHPRSRSGGGRHPSRSVSSSSSSPPLSSDRGGGPKDEEDADDRAWLSINQRLELPSLPAPPPAHMATEHGGGPAVSPAGVSGSIPIPPPRGRRHHQRSITTSMVTSSNYRTGHGLAIDPNTVQRLRSSPERKKRREKPKKE